MAAEPKYDMTVYPVQVAVRSASDGAAVHMVTLPYCDCADFTNRRGQLAWAQDAGHAVTVCKHIREALERVGGWHRPEPAAKPEVVRLKRAHAHNYLTGRQVTEREASRALDEAERGGRGYAGLPGSGSIPVRYADGWFSIG